MPDSSQTGFYGELGLRPVINCQSHRTVLGGSILSDQVWQGMVEANSRYIPMAELLEKAGEYIADLLGTEAAYVTPGCAAALALSTSACMTGQDREKMAQLPDTTGIKNEVLIPKKLRYSYDRAYTITGASLVEVGDDEGCSEEQLEEAIGPNTAAVAYWFQADPVPGVISLEKTVEIAHQHDVPVISDAAAQNYPLDFFRENAQAADLVCFGGKYFGGPNATGLVCGKKELIDAVVDYGFIGYYSDVRRAVGRPMKVDKHGVIAVLAALKEWFTMNHEDRLEDIENKLAVIKGAVDDLVHVEPNVETLPLPSTRHRYWGSSLYVTIDPTLLGKSAPDVVRELDEGNPRIWVAARGNDTIQVNTQALRDGEEVIVAERLRSVLAGAR